MTRQIRVLAVDDDLDWREIISETLERGGYYTETVATIEDARALLNTSFYHFAILDKNFNDSDVEDESGMKLLRELSKTGRHQATKVIMLSAYGTMEDQREAFRDLDIVDFITKQTFDDRDFLRNFREKLVPRLQINLDLEIHWQGRNSLEEAVVGLNLERKRIKRDSELQEQAATELDDLIARLFPEATQVLLRPMQRGASGSGVLWAEPTYEGRGGGNPLIVKFGDAAEIHDEAENYRRSVANFIGGARSTHLERERRTALLGGICYSFVGLASGFFENWRDFYSKTNINGIKPVLDNLFCATCARWYANLGVLVLADLADLYKNALGFDHDKLNRAFENNLRAVHPIKSKGQERIKFDRLKSQRSFLHPLEEWSRPRSYKTYLCDTHGDLNADNLIIDGGGSTWLIDFQRTGRGHFLRDFAQLDATVRFELLQPAEATLEERLLLEEALLGISLEDYAHGTPAVRLESDNAALIRAFETSIYIRHLASKQIQRNTEGSIEEYHAASFYLALNWIRFQGTSREHAFLSAALIREKIGL